MKKFSVLCLVFCLLFSVSCALLPTGEVSVTLVAGNGEENRTVRVPAGKTLSLTDAPARTGYVFTGWYLDADGTGAFDASEPVRGDLVLYAGWEPDYVLWTNAIAERVTDAAMTVTLTYSVSPFPYPVKGSSSGSGILIAKDGDTYYCLTCNHCVTPKEKATKTELTLRDGSDRDYTVALVGQSADYDLALLSFRTENDLPTVNIAKENPADGEAVAAIGTPKGKHNVLTFGTVSRYESVTLDSAAQNQSNVTFPVIRHTAPIASGSSGGALLNAKLELCGISYADGVDRSGSFACGFAVPAEKIRAFLSLYLKLSEKGS